jgi:hydroxymethylglutaryl-CoA synthase
MPGIVGYGVYLPTYRIKLEDIAEAWNRKGLRLIGEKTVPAFDETTLTMGLNAVYNALKHAGLSADEVGAVYFSSISSPIEGSCAQDLAVAIGANSSVQVADLHGSPRALTAAIYMCLDAISMNRIKYGIVVGSEILVGGMGTSAAEVASEYTSAAGAGALIFGSEDPITKFQATASFTSGMKERWRDTNESFTHTGDGRFIRDLGYMTHVATAGKMLLTKENQSIADFNHIILQQPHGDWIGRTLVKLGISKDALKSKLIAPGMHINNFGDLGNACLPVALSQVLDIAQGGEKILTISYGAGGSDALSWEVQSSIKEKRARATPVEKFLRYKEYINYTTMLRYNKVIKQFV